LYSILLTRLLNSLVGGFETAILDGAIRREPDS